MGADVQDPRRAEVNRVSYRTSTLRILAVRAAIRDSCKGGRTHTPRACCTAFFGATAAGAFFGATAGAGAFLFVLRNSLGTWNVPNLLCRAKTPWS